MTREADCSVLTCLCRIFSC